MSQLDKLKETLNTLRAALAIIAALLIALGSGVGVMFEKNNFGFLFITSIVVMLILVLAGFLIVRTINKKTNEIGEL